MNKGEFKKIFFDAVSAEAEQLREGLDGEQGAMLAKIVENIAKETILVGASETEEQRNVHWKNIQHYKSALCSMSGIGQIRAYRAIISVIGRVLAGISSAAIKSAL